MRLLHSRNAWHYRQGSDPAVDFCLWVLQVDGLHVPPFDQHPDGDGSLRALGLTEDSWQTWFLRVLDPVQSKRDMEQLRQLHLAEYLNISGESDMEHLERRLQAVHLKISTDPLRQMVLEELGDARMFYGIVDLATVQFLREKQRPGWRLYEVTFREIDGEQHRMISILQQNDDGSWRWNGGGTSSDMQNQWSKIFAPVRDHPLIFLGTQGVNFGDQQYLQIAHGDVIDI
jgi:hypothetical protein